MNLHSTWKPDRPISSGASAYHRAIFRASWHQENINELIRLLGESVRPGSLIVDFGAGTGASAAYLIKAIKNQCQFILVDNSPSWLAKAYALLSKRKNVFFSLLSREQNGYLSLEKIVGSQAVDLVISANTMHLIPDIELVFAGIYRSLRDGGEFIFSSGNITGMKQEVGVLMIEDSIDRVHDLAIELIRSDERFVHYRTNLDLQIESGKKERRFIFPEPRKVQLYLDALIKSGFIEPKVSTALITVKYADWLKFLRVRRLQTGMLPEVGGTNASLKEAADRDLLISLAALSFFEELKHRNKLATADGFIAQWTYVQAKKISA